MDDSKPASCDPTEGFERYLAAKKTVDDRSLNRTVLETLRSHLDTDRTLQVLELGAGIGTMVERLVQWGLLARGNYTAVDASAGLRRAARNYLQRVADRRRWQWCPTAADCWRMSSERFDLRLHWRTADVALPGITGISAQSFDVLIAHAFLDLVDLKRVLARMTDWVKPDGLLYLTLNFDGETILLPEYDAAFDARVIQRYHHSMDTRRIHGRTTGGSRTGRQLLERLAAGGSEILAAGSSDWIVVPQKGGYAGDEAYFLHYLVGLIQNQLSTDPRLETARLRNWAEHRHLQIEEGRLIFIAKQLDILARA